MWLNCKVTKKWQPPYFYINPPPFSGLTPLSSKKFRTPFPSDLIFGRSYPPPPLIRGGGGSNYVVFLLFPFNRLMFAWIISHAIDNLLERSCLWYFDIFNLRIEIVRYPLWYMKVTSYFITFTAFRHIWRPVWGVGGGGNSVTFLCTTVS